MASPKIPGLYARCSTGSAFCGGDSAALILTPFHSTFTKVVCSIRYLAIMPVFLLAIEILGQRAPLWLALAQLLQFARNATIGSILDALHAGIYPATAATAINNAPTSTNVAGSPVVIPNNRLPSVLDNIRDPTIPNASPNAANPSVRAARCRVAVRQPTRPPPSESRFPAPADSPRTKLPRKSPTEAAGSTRNALQESRQQQHQEPSR